MTPFGQPKFTLVKTPLKNPWFLVDPSMSAGIFAAFSKFFLNISKYPNGKVVCFVEGHNFHVGRHCWFGVQKGEKWKSMPVGTIHWSQGFLQLGIKFGHKWLRKRPYALCKSCRGLIGLQLLYLSLIGHCSSKIWRKIGSNRAKWNFKRADPRHVHDRARRRRGVPTRRPERVHRGPPPTAGLCGVSCSLW
jgi:hypothetical protein